MKITEISINQSVRHPDHDGCGTVTRIEPKDIEVFFNDGKRTLDMLEIGRLNSVGYVDIGHVTSLEVLLEAAAVAGINLVNHQNAPIEIGNKWDGGSVIFQPKDATLNSKEVPIDAFFHKIVMVRDSLRVLEQKINSNPKLSESEKIEMQQYITRMAGSLTTFNVLFKHKEEQF